MYRFYSPGHSGYCGQKGRISFDDYVKSWRFKEQAYERLVAQRNTRVLHLEAGDVEHDVFLEKVRVATDSQ